MNFLRIAFAAFRGLIPRQLDTVMRFRQTRIVNELFLYEVTHYGDTRVTNYDMRNTVEIWRRK